MTSATFPARGKSSLLWLELAAASLITLFALFVYLNGAFFSPFSALHVDLSINITAAHALRDGQDPYGDSVLRDRAIELGSPTTFLYESLFTSYIQPPTSALSVMPLTLLDWREATRAYLILNNLLIAGAVGLTLLAVRPSMPRHWAIAVAAVTTAGYSQIYGSLALGQVDSTMTFLLALALWAYSRGRETVTGAAIAAGVAVKLIPGVLLLYFLWKREYRIVAWAIAIGSVAFLASVPLAGIDAYRTYFTETVPALLKGSTYFTNISFTGLYNRMFVEELGGLGPLIALEEVPSRIEVRLLGAATTIVLVLIAAAAMGRARLGPRRILDAARGPGLHNRLGGGGPELGWVLEFYLVVVAGLMISSVTWEFYTVWLLPLFVAVFAAPGRILPGGAVLRLALLAGFVLAYVGLNYPGDHYFFDVNGFFYHPDWVPGIIVEDWIDLYPLPPADGGHPEIVPRLRLAVLCFLALTLLAAITVVRLRHAAAVSSLRTPAP